MPNTRIYLTALLPLVVLAACGTTKHFVEQPHLTIDDPQKDPRQAIGELFQLTPPYKVTLCEADLTSKQCATDSKGITS